MEVGFDGSGDGFGSVCADGARSECLKQERPGFYGDFWRASKLAKTEAHDFSLDASTLPYFNHMEATHGRNSGSYSSGGLDASSGVYLLSGVRGPFTPSQWLELEQQALIYKYIISNEPIPVHLLNPIRRAFESAGFYGATLKSNSWGWGPLHLGYSNSTEPEPGRCRRTDGKKWRCARDAVANQKYCEKHMNRGRHRSRKHVEGHSVSVGATKSSTTKPMPSALATPSAVASVLPGGGSSNGFDIHQHQHFQGKSLHPTSSLSRMIVNGENSGQVLQDATQLSYLSQGMSTNGFGQPSSESLSNIASQNHYGSCAYILNDHGGAGLQSQSGSIQLSMSSTSSPNNEKADVSPLRLSQAHEMGLGFGSQFQSPIQENWKPISWEASMGGPLAEALQSSSTSNSTDDCKKSSALVSLSNSSAGSSPRADNSKTIESGGGLCTDLLGSATLALSSSLPALS